MANITHDNPAHEPLDNGQDPVANEWFLREHLLTFTQAARLLALRQEKEVGMSPSTIWRWFKRGCLSKSGKRVYLAACRIGGRNMTSLQRMSEFINRLNDEEGPAAAIVRLPVSSPTDTRRLGDTRE